MNEQEKEQLLESLVALRSEGLTLRKRLLAVPDIQHRLTVCLAKLDAFDAAITMEIDDLRYNEEEQA